MVKVGCRNCRRRHSKCVILEGASTCNKCADNGRRCQFAPRYRFKVVRHIYQKEGDARSRFILQWDKGQPWVEVSKPRMYSSILVSSLVMNIHWHDCLLPSRVLAGILSVLRTGSKLITNEVYYSSLCRWKQRYLQRARPR